MVVGIQIQQRILGRQGTVYRGEKGKGYEYLSVEEAPDALVHKYLKISPNLCLYIKAVLLYAPTRKIVESKLIKWIGINIIIAGILYGEQTSSIVNGIMLGLGYLVFVALAFLCTLAGIITILKSWYDTTPAKAKKPSFYGSVIKPYMKARKEKVCPFLTFE